VEYWRLAICAVESAHRPPTVLVYKRQASLLNVAIDRTRNKPYVHNKGGRAIIGIYVRGVSVSRWMGS